ncbi:hypothetical protein RUM44_012058 [Polyplax serrata]|uniref:Uncharacterized protein n=1 Tax=Polyplax serrata TaxID=468196 RepID=A0ABR1BA82_POLSC
MEIDAESIDGGENPANLTEKCESTSSGKRQVTNNEIRNGKINDIQTDDSSKKKKATGDRDGDSENTAQISGTLERSNGKGDGFPKVKSKFKNRNYRNKSQPESSGDRVSSGDEEDANGSNVKNKQQTALGTNPCSPDSGIPEASSSNGAADEYGSAEDSMEMGGWVPDFSIGDNTEAIERGDAHNSSSSMSCSASSSSSDSSMSAMEDSKYDAIDSDKEDPPSVLLKQKPKHKWFAIPEIINRQVGFSNKKQGSELFQHRMYGSLHSVQRLELMYKLKYHSGCVNSLNFNQTGTLLASGSDDLHICLWDWPLGKPLISFDSGHKSNVFQAKFLPLTGDTHLVTCARDGQIRLVELDGSGELRSKKKLGQHIGPAHKLAIQNETPHVFLSCGEDALVMSLDVRQPKPAKVLFVKEEGKKVSLYSINSNPLNSNEFVVCGRDVYLKVYDQRNTSTWKSKFYPQHLSVEEPTHHVTCAVFNYNGTEIVASYNDEDIYLFDTRHSSDCDFVHRYQGHKNSATVKGVNFFGPKSEFIVSGSDCGNIFFWEKETEAIVQWMAGDDNGVVNCLEPHPEIPVLATSGLDEDVKIWVPSCEQEPTLEGLKKTVIANLKSRNSDPLRSSDALDGQMLWILWRHITRTERQMNQDRERARGRSAPSEPPQDGGSSDESSVYSDDEESQGGQGRRLQCSPS